MHLQKSIFEVPTHKGDVEKPDIYMLDQDPKNRSQKPKVFMPNVKQTTFVLRDSDNTYTPVNLAEIEERLTMPSSRGRIFEQNTSRNSIKPTEEIVVSSKPPITILEDIGKVPERPSRVVKSENRYVVKDGVREPYVPTSTMRVSHVPTSTRRVVQEPVERNTVSHGQNYNRRVVPNRNDAHLRINLSNNPQVQTEPNVIRRSGRQLYTSEPVRTSHDLKTSAYD